MSNFFVPASIQEFADPLTGVVERAIAPNKTGQIKLLGSYWPAQFYHSDCQVTVLPDEPVAVVGICGITLLVSPLPSQGQAISQSNTLSP